VPDDLFRNLPSRDSPEGKMFYAMNACLALLHIVADDQTHLLLSALGAMVEDTLRRIDDDERQCRALEFIRTFCEQMGFRVEED
jgi:hypothetical protein